VALGRVPTLAAVGTPGGLGGCLVAQATQYIAPPTFGPELSVILLAMALAGGVRYLLAGIVGMLVLEAIPNMARMAVTDREILVAAVLFVVLVFLPNGILGLCFGVARRLRGESEEA
jgi:branched-chain amino acid transport system permease protein